MNWLTDRMAILLLILTGLLVWGNTIFNPFIIIDDEEQIINQPQIRDLGNIPHFFVESTYFRSESQSHYGGNYRPLMQVAYTLLYAMHGPDPLVFHLFQLLIIICNAVLFFIFLKKCCSLAIAFVLATIFLIHPISSEVVLHAANLQDALNFFFGIVSLLFVSNVRVKKSWSHLVVLTALLSLSLFSKESGVIFVGLTIVYAYTYVKNKFGFVLASSSIASLIYIFTRVIIAKISYDPKISIALIAHLPLSERALAIPKIVGTYIKDIVYPMDISIAQFWVVRNINMNNFIIHIIILAVTFFLTGKFITHNWNKTKYRKMYIFSLIWIIISLLPHIQIVPISATYAERWFYPVTAGVLLLIGAIWNDLGEKMKRHRFIQVLCFGMLIFFAYISFERTYDWRDSKTLLLTDIAKSEANYYAQNVLASIYIGEKNYDQAKPLVETSLATYQYFGNLSNRGIIAIYEKDYATAREYLKKARADRQLYETHRNYANFLQYVVKDYSEALKASEESLKLYPDSGDLWLIKAQAEYELGKKEEALTFASKANALLDTIMAKDILLTIREGNKLDVEKYLDK